MPNKPVLTTFILLTLAVNLADASPQSSTPDVDLTNPDVAAIVQIAKEYSAALGRRCQAHFPLLRSGRHLYGSR